MSLETEIASRTRELKNDIGFYSARRTATQECLVKAIAESQNTAETKDILMTLLQLIGG